MAERPLTLEVLHQRFDSVAAVIDGLTALETALYAQQDRRAVFASAYLTMTREIEARVGGQGFNDPAWVGQYAIAFANLYRSAFLAYESGSPDATPPPWRTSFDVAVHKRGLVIQDLLLGMNAHINHDLALSLVEVSIDTDREARREDHFAVNEAIRHAVDAVQHRISEQYGRIYSIVDRVFEGVDEHTTVFSIEKARRNAWTSALSLADARSEAEREAALQAIVDRSNVIARLILLPTRGPVVFHARRLFERVTAPWKLITPGF